MLIYLDTRDLINVMEHGKPCPADEFGRHLHAGGHDLALSFSNVRELIQPLFKASTNTVVMRLLNDIERLPLRYIREAYICPQEIEEAFAAFSEAREYAGISPFVHRFDEVCTHWKRRPATAGFLNLSLSETVFMIYSAKDSALLDDPNVFAVLRSLLEADRTMENQPTLRENFVQAVGRHIQQARLPVPTTSVAALADWIYDEPTRCPSSRLSYELYHSVRVNLTDAARRGDILDTAHAGCIPYVDLITLDARMRDYVRRVSERTRPEWGQGVCRDLNEVLDRLSR